MKSETKQSSEHEAIQQVTSSVQLELDLRLPSAAIFSFPAVKNEPRGSEDAQRRLYEFASRLPVW